MKSESFVYWLMGFFEISNTTEINKEQTEIIKKHLNLVFKHEIDPSMGDEAHQLELNQIHHNGPQNTGGGIFPNGNDTVLRC